MVRAFQVKLQFHETRLVVCESYSNSHLSSVECSFNNSPEKSTDLPNLNSTRIDICYPGNLYSPLLNFDSEIRLLVRQGEIREALRIRGESPVAVW
jgi:hypothetical protein